MASQGGQKKSSTAALAITFAALAGLYWYVTAGERTTAPANALEDIHRQVANDTAAQYAIAKRSGSRADACAHAHLAAEAALQAHDETGYQKWTATATADCAP